MRSRRWLVFVAGLSLVALTGCQATSQSSSTTSQCTSDRVHQVVGRFVDAFNKGDLAQLNQLVSEQRFGWYSSDAPGQRLEAEATDRATLMAYFAARHQQHERLVLKSADVTFITPGRGGFWFRLTRSADDGLPPTAYNGKGEIQCATTPSSLVVWAMDPAPWWPPYDLLSWAGALLVAAAAIGGVFLWHRRRRKARPSVTPARD